MLNRIIKISFAIVGGITGLTISKTLFFAYNSDASQSIKIVIYAATSTTAAALFYFVGNRFIEFILEFVDKLETFIQNMTLYELAISSVGLIAGLIVANLAAIPINKIDIIGIPLAIIVNMLCGCLGVGVALRKRNEAFLVSKKNDKNNLSAAVQKLVDTSVIIDGRIVDICRAGFMEGDLIVPSFVLEELRHIADSSDPLKRNRGRRGLDVLNMLQKDMGYPVKIENIEIPPYGNEVDDKLLKAAAKLKAKVITLDYNLSKVASFQGVPVLNINELANAVKPIALPGEEMSVQVIKDGKENGQGIGYMDDGTMIVVDGGRKHMGEVVNVMVTSVLQTAAGRMIFAKPKYQAERVIS